MTRLGFEDFTVRLNHRRLLSAILEQSGLPTGQHGDALIAIDKLDKLDRDKVILDMVARGIDPATASRCLDAFARPQAADERGLLDSLAEALSQHSEGARAVADVEDLLQLCEATPAAGRIRIDLSLARGLSYYTGAIMEIAVAGIGSLGGGGRYDNLIGMFLGRDIPACGFSLGLERIIVVMGERGLFPPAAQGAAIDVVVTFMEAESRTEALKLAAELRARGRRVDVYPEASRKFDKALKYAAGRGAAVMGIIGENERAKGVTSVRNLATREQTSVRRADAAAFIVGLLNPPL
jgi:histidyl-tRNA synthetase